VKRVKIKRWGTQNRTITIDADATQGAEVGKDLKLADGTVVKESDILNSKATSTAGSPVIGGIASTLWSLIQNLPAIISNLIGLTNVGVVHHTGSAVLTAHNWLTVKNSIAAGEIHTIPSGQQLIVFDQFTFDGGILTLHGDSGF